MISCLIWNVRGISGVVIQRRLKRLKIMHNIKLMVILEPMVNVNKAEYVRRRLGFETVISNVSQKIWIFCSEEIGCEVLLDHV